jgi:cell division initiation protein
MALTPVEIRHIRLGRRLVGYPRPAVERLLDEIADSFEDVWRDRADLADKVEQLEGDLVRYRELETLLRTTLVSAERAAHELKDQAKREAELIVGEAHSEARSITREAAAERERLLAESRRVQALLRAALQTLEGSGGGGKAKAEAA